MGKIRPAGAGEPRERTTNGYPPDRLLPVSGRPPNVASATELETAAKWYSARAEVLATRAKELMALARRARHSRQCA